MLTLSGYPAPDGEPYQQISLCNASGLTIQLVDWGASWLSALVPVPGSHCREVLLGCRTLPDWQTQQAFLGASVGRYANRIANSCFGLDGRQISVQPSQGRHQLHGGPQGFDKRRWQIASHCDTAVVFRLTSPDGDQGFTGELNASAEFRLTPDNRVMIDYQAQVNQPCPVNLTSHAYFNLDGALTDVRQHHLQLCADYFLPVDEEGIPCADLQTVAYSGFDFRQGKKIADDFLCDVAQQRVNGYDHGFLLNVPRDISQPVGCLSSGDNKLQMRIYTSAPALQLYTGNYLQGVPARQGGIYQNWQGLALETGWLADSPNHPHWPQPDCIVRPGQNYRNITQYQFITA